MLQDELRILADHLKRNEREAIQDNHLHAHIAFYHRPVMKKSSSRNVLAVGDLVAISMSGFEEISGRELLLASNACFSAKDGRRLCA